MKSQGLLLSLSLLLFPFIGAEAQGLTQLHALQLPSIDEPLRTGAKLSKDAAVAKPPKAVKQVPVA